MVLKSETQKNTKKSKLLYYLNCTIIPDILKLFISEANK